MFRPHFAALLTTLTILIPAPSSAGGPVTREEGQRQPQAIDLPAKEVAASGRPTANFAATARASQHEPGVQTRRRILEIAARVPAEAEREALLTNLLAADPDAGLRSEAATTLGRHGSERALAALARCAAEDRATEIRVGDVGGRGTARRAATFAIAELAARHPAAVDAATAKLRALPAIDDPKDNESLADARA